ncbi:DegT/DnrJ/EryC1/StrS family aminotransferase [Kribbella sp. NPDC051620]|uniref:DegT/DnrJ/EryC1/StrS family aminotransferase n=1 Tax=Kribbella sp. NPDC051620 TaxID=3364120 RepID=UPI00378D215C
MTRTAPAQLAIRGGQPLRTQPYPAWPRPDDRSEQAVLKVLRSGHWWQSGGGSAERLEEWLTSYHGVGASVAVANGTVALEIAFRALGVGPGDDVLVPALTFFSTASAVAAVGASPVPVDVLPDTLCLDVEAARHCITDRTKAIVPVHLAGQPADLDAVTALASVHGLYVVEDAAQAVGAQWNQRPVGSYGDVATLSFQAAKLLSGGEGGAILVRDDNELAERVRRLANCGRARGSAAYEHIGGATNGRISEFSSALVLAQTADLKDLKARREVAALFLAEELESAGLGTVTRIDARVTSMPWYMVVIRLSEAVLARITTDEYAQALTAEGVPASRMYKPFHQAAAFAGTATALAVCPVAEDAARSSVWLHHRLLLDGRSGIRDIVDAMRKLDHYYRSHDTNTKDQL